MSARNERYSEIGSAIEVVFSVFFKVGAVVVGILIRQIWIVMNKNGKKY